MTINKVLNLRHTSDKRIFYEELKRSKDLPFSIQEIKSAINFISSNLKDDGWLVVYPGLLSENGMSITHGSLIVKIQIASRNGKPLYHFCRFMDEIVPLGLDLLQLRKLPRFESYLKRLNISSHERTSAMLETFVAARAKRSGFGVEIEPPNGKGGLCDLRVSKTRLRDIYIECKALNSYESELHQKRQVFLQGLSLNIWKRSISYIPSGRSIIIELPGDYRRRNTMETWVESILSALKNKEYDEWKLVDGIRYRIHFGQYTGTLRARELMVGSGSTPGWYEVQITSPIGNASSSLRSEIKEAKHQIPDKQQGAIVVQTQDFDILTSIATERLSGRDYKNIVCIAGVNATHNIKTIKNRTQSTIHDSFDLFP
ncbi:MAG: hypothetical protein ACRD47_06175 [Nitrososphaeraceae archaeon]